jgi:hypothetical protein
VRGGPFVANVYFIVGFVFRSPVGGLFVSAMCA